MPLLFLIFFGVYGWIEFEVFIVIGGIIGGLVTFLGIFATAFVGVALMKRQGASIMQHWQSSFNKGEISVSTLASGISLLLGAILMLLPGYVTDFAGLLCFLPGLRTLIGRAVLSRLSTTIFLSGLGASFSTRFGAAGRFSPYDRSNSEPNTNSTYARHHTLGGDVIEGQFESKDD